MLDGSRDASETATQLPQGQIDNGLDSESARLDLAKLRYETEEASAWKIKFVLSGIVAPFGSVLLFLAGWYGSHATERRRQDQDLYASAAKQLSSADGSVRLGAVTTLDRYISPPPPTGLSSLWEWHLSQKDGNTATLQRERDSMALLIGSLARENDPAVLDAIKQDVLHNPSASVLPLISTNKTAAVLFARSAGAYSGLSVLHLNHARSVEEDRWRALTTTSIKHEGKPDTLVTNDPTVTDIVFTTLRTGSPFEASALLNQRFLSRNFLTTNRCPFSALFNRQRILTMNSGFADILRTRPPNDKEVEAARTVTINAAATLERSSYILAELAKADWQVLEDRDLYGTAIVVGELDGKTIKRIQSRGGYFSSAIDDDQNPGCMPLAPSIR